MRSVFDTMRVIRPRPSSALNYDTPPGLEVAAGRQGKIVRLSGQWTALALARGYGTWNAFHDACLKVADGDEAQDS